MKWVLYVATVIGFIAYNCWKIIKESTGILIFDKLMAIFICLLCCYIYYKEKQSFIKFFLFEVSVSNIIKEFCLNPGILTLQEALLIVIIPSIWYFKEDNKTW